MKKFSLFDIMNYIFFTLLCIVMLYPFWHTVIGSIMPYSEYMKHSILLYPTKINLETYEEIIQTGLIFNPLKVTVLITIVGTITSLFFTALAAYALSKKFLGSVVIMNMIVLSMFLKSGLIPEYINLKSLHLINTLAVYILPSLIVAYDFIIMRTSFAAFPKEMEESATIDGCSQYRIFFSIVIPLSKPILAAIGIFYAVKYWNIYSQSVFFVTDSAKKTMQDFISRIIMESTEEFMDEKILFTETVKMANIVIAVTPILIVYPFLQKYFVKGVMIGAIKG